MNDRLTPTPRAENPRRFVVLQHTDAAGLHFDLMIDLGPALATWKFAQPPEDAVDGSLPCQRIGNHRRVYLDYEGPVSGDRGQVVRHDAGDCDAANDDGRDWLVTFRGEKLSGRYRLKSMDTHGDAYLCESIPG